jgi:hypothetical protein
MSTRRLILLALVCGLAILIAGGVKLLQVADQDASVEILGLGDVALVGDMDVTVTQVQRRGDATLVSIELGGVATPDAADGWVMLGDGERHEPRGACGAVPETGILRCDLTFDPVDRVQAVAYARGGEQRQWRP